MKPPAEMVCHELVELVTTYLEGALPPEERDRFEAHRQGCPGCTPPETPVCRLAPGQFSGRLGQARSRKRPRPFVIDCGSKQYHVSSIMSKSTFTAILEREGDVYVALCPELDIASQGGTIEEATANLREAVALFLETADSREITQRLRSGVFVTTFDVVDG